MSGHQHNGAAQLRIKIVDYDLNMSFHCNGLSSVVANLKVFCHCRGLLEAQQLITRTTDEIVMHVFDLLLFVEVHPERDLEHSRVFLDGAGDDISNEEIGKRLFTLDIFLSNCWRVSSADSSVISLEMFIRYVRCFYSIVEHSFLMCVVTTCSAASRLSSSSSSLVIFRVAIALSRKTTTDR